MQDPSSKRPEAGNAGMILPGARKIAICITAMVLGVNIVAAIQAPQVCRNAGHIFMDTTRQTVYFSEMFVVSPDLDHWARLGSAGANARSIF